MFVRPFSPIALNLVAAHDRQQLAFYFPRSVTVTPFVPYCYCCFQIPFSLTLRVWDLYLLEGERVMIGMAYTIVRVHRRYLMKLGMDELIEHLQISLEKDFGFEDDVVVEKLKEAINELGSMR